MTDIRERVEEKMPYTFNRIEERLGDLRSKDLWEFIQNEIEDYRTTLLKEIEGAKEPVIDDWQHYPQNNDNSNFNAGLDKAGKIIRGDKI